MSWARITTFYAMEELSRARQRPVAVLPHSSSRSGASGMAARLERHAKNLHSELGVHRQTDLVRLDLSTAAVALAEQPAGNNG